MVDGRWLDCVSHHDQLFRDEYALYRPLQVVFSGTASESIVSFVAKSSSSVGIKTS